MIFINLLKCYIFLISRECGDIVIGDYTELYFKNLVMN